MTVPVVASSAGVLATGTRTVVLTKPSGLAVGDLLTAEILVESDTAPTPTVPSGWTIPTGANPTFASGLGMLIYVAYKVATSTEVAATNFSFSATGSGASNAAHGVIKRITGADTTNPITVTPTNNTVTTGTTGTFPSITTTVADTLVLLTGGVSYNPGTPSGSEYPNVQPSGVTASTGVPNAANLEYLGTGYFSQTTAGATGTKTVAVHTLTGGVGVFQGIAFAINPPSSSPQTLSPPLLSNTNTLYAPSLQLAAIPLSPPLLANTNTLYAPTLNLGTITLSPGLLSNTATLYAPSLTVGAVTLSPGLLSNSPILYPPALNYGGALQILSPPLLANSNTLYAPSLTVGAVTLSPGLLSNTPVLYPPAILQAGPQTLSPPLLLNVPVLFLPTVANDNPGGVYPLSITGNASIRALKFASSGSVTAGAIAGAPRVIAGKF